MTRVAVTKGTLQIPPTYFAVQHTERLLAEQPERFTVRTFTMALQLDDASVRDSGLDIVEVAAMPGGPFRRREVSMPFSFRKLSRAVVDFEPDVIHQHFATWSTPAVTASRISGAPLIVTLHGADVFAALRPVNAAALHGRPMLAWHHASVARVFARARRVLPVSRYLADCAIDAGARSGTVDVHYQGIDTDYFAPVVDSADTRDGAMPELVFVGAFNRAKGVRDLVDASTRLVGKQPHRLVLIGRGPLREALRESATQHPHIDLVGPLNREAVRDRLRRARLLVLPTQLDNGSREAAGLVLLEAQACGVPVITYNSGGAPEMLDDGHTGRVVAERDVAALAVAIADILRLSDSDHARMGADARQWVVRHRSLASSARQLAEFYDSPM